MKQKTIRQAYVETWWGEQVPDYAGMIVEIREISPVAWKNAVSNECIRWAAERFRSGKKMLMFRFPVISKEELELVGVVITKRLKSMGIMVEVRVLDNGMIDVIRKGVRDVVERAAKKPKDRWSIFLKK